MDPRFNHTIEIKGELNQELYENWMEKLFSFDFR